jgi:hypothetical protein
MQSKQMPISSDLLFGGADIAGTCTLPLQAVQFPIKYLGILANKLSVWKGQLMHHSSCLALIKSTLAAMPVYLSISIGLPEWMHKALENIMKGFLWISTNVFQKVKCTIVWGKVQCPLQMGGLGIVDLKLFGMALGLQWL